MEWSIQGADWINKFTWKVSFIIPPKREKKAESEVGYRVIYNAYRFHLLSSYHVSNCIKFCVMWLWGFHLKMDQTCIFSPWLLIDIFYKSLYFSFFPISFFFFSMSYISLIFLSLYMPTFLLKHFSYSLYTFIFLFLLNCFFFIFTNPPSQHLSLFVLSFFFFPFQASTSLFYFHLSFLSSLVSHTLGVLNHNLHVKNGCLAYLSLLAHLSRILCFVPKHLLILMKIK